MEKIDKKSGWSDKDIKIFKRDLAKNEAQAKGDYGFTKKEVEYIKNYMLVGEESPKTKEEAREYAIRWQYWFSDKEKIYYSELADWNYIFWKLARKFHLVREFKENGII